MYLRSSSISRTLASKLLQAFSFSCNSFILLFIVIVFLVIFLPGLLILSSHGSHWRNTLFTWNSKMSTQLHLVCSISYPSWHDVCFCCSVMVIEDNNREDDAAGHHHHDAVEVRACTRDTDNTASVNILLRAANDPSVFTITAFSWLKAPTSGKGREGFQKKVWKCECPIRIGKLLNRMRLSQLAR